jgi:bifunctional DNase/RNase
MGAGTVQGVREWRNLSAGRHVLLSVTEVVRLHGDRAVVVLEEERALPATGGAHEARSIGEERALPATGGAREARGIGDRSHARRLPVPVTLQDGTSIERRLQPGAPHSLAARAIDALGSRIVRVSIDVHPTGGLSGTLVVARGIFGSRELPVETAEAIRVALDEGAPIETSEDLLEVAGVSEEEARTLALDGARGRAPEASSLPVHTF